ncbi:nitrile hydratase accessory protein [Mycobacterium sp. URHB0021]|jgi:nitrile hydratase accessory protein
MTSPMDIDAPVAPPRANGELVFAEPWESRAFAMAVSLYDAGMFTWPQFQAALIARLASWEASSTKNLDWNYYHHWLGALEDLIAGCGALLPDDVTTRAAALAHRPVGHDHAH